MSLISEDLEVDEPYSFFLWGCCIKRTHVLASAVAGLPVCLVLVMGNWSVWLSSILTFFLHPGNISDSSPQLPGLLGCFLASTALDMAGNTICSHWPDGRLFHLLSYKVDICCCHWSSESFWTIALIFVANPVPVQKKQDLLFLTFSQPSYSYFQVLSLLLLSVLPMKFVPFLFCSRFELQPFGNIIVICEQKVHKAVFTWNQITNRLLVPKGLANLKRCRRTLAKATHINTHT